MTKKEILLHFESLLKEKMAACDAEIRDIQLSMSSETKSSAGDKHETSREMMKQSRNQVENQLAHYQLQMRQIKELEGKKSSCVEAGSWVSTEEEEFFFGLALGKVKLGNSSIFALSTQAPIAQAFLNKKAGEKVEFRGKIFTLLNVQ